MNWQTILKDISDPTEGVENLLTVLKFFQAQVEEWNKRLSGSLTGSHREGYLPKYDEIKEILGDDWNDGTGLILEGRDLFRHQDP